MIEFFYRTFCTENVHFCRMIYIAKEENLQDVKYVIDKTIESKRQIDSSKSDVWQLNNNLPEMFFYIIIISQAVVVGGLVTRIIKHQLCSNTTSREIFIIIYKIYFIIFTVLLNKRKYLKNIYTNDWRFSTKLLIKATNVTNIMKIGNILFCQ